MSNTYTIQRVFGVDESGQQRFEDITVTLNESLLFEVKMPEHLGGQSETFHSVGALRNFYESSSAQYADVCKAQAGEKMLGLHFKHQRNDSEKFTRLTLSVLPLFKTDEGLMEETGVRPLRVDSYIAVPYTEEAEVKAKALVASINTAGEIIAGLKSAADPLAYLLAIDFPGAPKTELSSEPAAGDNPKLAEPAPAATASDDDEL